MRNQIGTQIVTFSQNGFEDDAKFIEVEGQKFVADESDPSKPKLDDKGAKIPFKAKEEDKGGKGRDDDSDKSLEDLAKTNPAVKKMLDDKKKLEDDARKAAEVAAEKNGEWQKLADERKTALEKANDLLAQKETMLGKYVTSVKQVLKEVMETIPAENKGLIPDGFSPREQLEYITKNAKLLGAKMSGKGGGGVNKNDEDVHPTEEAKVIADIEELRKKEHKTQADHTKIFELSKKLKEIRTASQGK